jgi:hypothetical protein
MLYIYKSVDNGVKCEKDLSILELFLFSFSLNLKDFGDALNISA